MFRAFATLAVLFALATFPVSAQTLHQLNVNIPFDFNVLGKVLPAGEYEVIRIGSGDAYAMKCFEQKASVVFQAIPHDYPRNSQPRLVFRRFGKENFLSQMWTTSKGVALNTSKAEREYTAQAIRPVIVAVVGKAYR